MVTSLERNIREVCDDLICLSDKRVIYLKLVFLWARIFQTIRNLVGL